MKRIIRFIKTYWLNMLIGCFSGFIIGFIVSNLTNWIMEDIYYRDFIEYAQPPTEEMKQALEEAEEMILAINPNAKIPTVELYSFSNEGTIQGSTKFYNGKTIILINNCYLFESYELTLSVILHELVHATTKSHEFLTDVSINEGYTELITMYILSKNERTYLYFELPDRLCLSMYLPMVIKLHEFLTKENVEIADFVYQSLEYKKNKEYFLSILTKQ